MTATLPAALAAFLVGALGDSCGVAAKVARALLAKPGWLLEEEDLWLAGGSSVESGRMLAALRIFNECGWCECYGARWRSKSQLPTTLPAFLEGAAAMRTLDGPPVKARAIITLPGRDSHLLAVLPGTGLAHAALEETRTAFYEIAAEAVRSLSVLSPFLNEAGLAWVLGLFRATSAPMKELVVRASNEILALLTARGAELRALDVRILDYKVYLPDGTYETFHAKAVLADDRVAYVGSANLLEYGRQSMELGVAVEGTVVYPISALFQAIRQVATPISLTSS